MKVRVAAAALFACAILGAATPALAASAWPVVQSFMKSSSVHSPTFISPQRGWALVGNRLLQTNEGGSRWSVAVPPEWTGITPRAISFGTPTTGWVVADNGVVFVTRDSGAHWSRQTADAISGHNWIAIRALSGTRAIAASTDGVLIGTNDGGITWTLRSAVAGGRLSALYFSDALHGWAAGADASGVGLVLETDDGGGMWVPRSTPMNSALSAVTFADSARGWAAGSAGVLSTSDGGATWVAVAAPSELLGAEHVSLAFTSATRGFLGREASSGGGPVLWETSDAGAHWTVCQVAEGTPGIAALVALSPANVLATGLSQTVGDTLTSARIWRWGVSSASGGAILQTASAAKKPVVTKAPAKKKVVKKASAKKKAARKKAAKKASAKKSR
jgi:photosystem II stability/assembly factor-like uncharacterized protein